VEEVLDGLLAEPRPSLLVLNKLDLVADEDVAAGLRVEHPGALLVSARTGEGLGALRACIWERAAAHAAGRPRAPHAHGTGRTA
jgi:GTP-binding protein HflX